MAKRKSASSSQHNPFRGFMDFMSEMNRAQEQFFLQHSGEPGRAGNAAHSHAYVPPTDIFAQGGDLIIRCEVAGAKKEDIHVTVTNGVLTIAGERHSELDESQVTYYTRERNYGEFRRDMLLPEGVNIDHVTAQTHNGLLEVVVSGAANTKTSNINVPISEHDDS